MYISNKKCARFRMFCVAIYCKLRNNNLHFVLDQLYLYNVYHMIYYIIYAHCNIVYTIHYTRYTLYTYIIYLHYKDAIYIEVFFRESMFIIYCIMCNTYIKYALVS